jgi:hypothetical protein
MKGIRHRSSFHSLHSSHCRSSLFNKVNGNETVAAHDIQFVPASRFHFVVVFFVRVQSSIDPRPVMSPTP